MVSVDAAEVRCADCGRTVFDGGGFFATAERGGTTAEAMAADVAAEGVTAVADSVLLLSSQSRPVETVDGGDFVRTPRFVEEPKRAFCSPECQVAFHELR
ncbi:hypothetical protein [Haloarchaeobius sp. TZWWS8]|uniref:hypothetical protein n=1 Tax=Haloarchaeobius sp. TZWWS8 TaxID=3446121 RepID=UPI003EBB4F56